MDCLSGIYGSALHRRVCALAACILPSHKSDHTQYEEEGWANWNRVKGRVVVISVLGWCGSCQKDRKVVAIGMSSLGHKHRSNQIKTQTANWNIWHSQAQDSCFTNALHRGKGKRGPNQRIPLKSVVKSLSEILGDSYWFFGRVSLIGLSTLLKVWGPISFSFVQLHLIIFPRAIDFSMTVFKSIDIRSEGRGRQKFIRINKCFMVQIRCAW